MLKRTGYGVPLVAEKYGKDAFEFLDFFLRVTIPFAFELENDDPQETENPIRKTGEKTGEKSVKAIFQNPNITIA